MRISTLSFALLLSSALCLSFTAINTEAEFYNADAASLADSQSFSKVAQINSLGLNDDEQQKSASTQQSADLKPSLPVDSDDDTTAIASATRSAQTVTQQAVKSSLAATTVVTVDQSTGSNNGVLLRSKVEQSDEDDSIKPEQLGAVESVKDAAAENPLDSTASAADQQIAPAVNVETSSASLMQSPSSDETQTTKSYPVEPIEIQQSTTTATAPVAAPVETNKQQSQQVAQQERQQQEQTSVSDNPQQQQLQISEQHERQQVQLTSTASTQPSTSTTASQKLQPIEDSELARQLIESKPGEGEKGKPVQTVIAESSTGASVQHQQHQLQLQEPNDDNDEPDSPSQPLYHPPTPHPNTPIPRSQVHLHNTSQDCWFIINGRIYDFTAALNTIQDSHIQPLKQLPCHANTLWTQVKMNYPMIESVMPHFQIGLLVEDAQQQTTTAFPIVSQKIVMTEQPKKHGFFLSHWLKNGWHRLRFLLGRKQKQQKMQQHVALVNSVADVVQDIDDDEMNDEELMQLDPSVALNNQTVINNQTMTELLESDFPNSDASNNNTDNKSSSTALQQRQNESVVLPQAPTIPVFPSNDPAPLADSRLPIDIHIVDHPIDSQIQNENQAQQQPQQQQNDEQQIEDVSQHCYLHLNDTIIDLTSLAANLSITNTRLRRSVLLCENLESLYSQLQRDFPGADQFVKSFAIGSLQALMRMPGNVVKRIRESYSNIQDWQERQQQLEHKYRQLIQQEEQRERQLKQQTKLQKRQMKQAIKMGLRKRLLEFFHLKQKQAGNTETTLVTPLRQQQQSSTLSQQVFQQQQQQAADEDVSTFPVFHSPYEQLTPYRRVRAMRMQKQRQRLAAAMNSN